MAVKSKSAFVCNECGYDTPKWQGKCPGCGAWNAMSAVSLATPAQNKRDGGFLTLSSGEPQKLGVVQDTAQFRFQTGIAELDRVLGGGFVPASLVLLAGDPGVGKSTLVLGALDALVKSGRKALYVTGEESPSQIRARAERLGLGLEIFVVAENDLAKILSHLDQFKPDLVVVDSIQTIFIPDLPAAPGSVSQVRESAGKLLYYSKTHGLTTVLIGHVTKDGQIAGPRVLEHMVDTVLSFEGESSGAFRLLRAIKNRYGSALELGVFEMTARGLLPVDNPSAHFLRRNRNDPGSCVVAALEGTRAILLEVQALVSRSPLANPRRTAVGVDPARVSLLIAVLEKILDVNLFNQDIYVNATGGLKLMEPSSDLAIMLSLMSSHFNRALPEDLIVVGEVGLSGEIRPVPQLERRLQEAKKLGFRQAVIPESAKKPEKINDFEMLSVSHVDKLQKLFF